MCEGLLKSAAPVLLVLFLFCNLSAQSVAKERKNDPTPADFALLEASVKGDVAGVQKALDEGAFVDTPTITQRRTPLMYAAGVGSEAVVRILLANKADPNLKTTSGETALTFAERGKHTEVVAILKNLTVNKTSSGVDMRISPEIMRLARGLTVEQEKPAGPKPTPTPAPAVSATTKHTRPEDVAAMFKALAEWESNTTMNTVRLINLMRGGLDPNVRDSSGKTPLIYAAAIREPYAALSWLLKSGADINAQTTAEGTTALMEAVARKNAFSVVHLAGAGAKTDIKDKKGRTALDIAKEVNDPVVLIFSDMLGILVSDADDRKATQTRALFRMINYREDQANRAKVSYDLMSYLMKLVGNMDGRDLFGSTPLMYAAANGDDTAITLLILNGAAVNAQNDDGMTALMDAVLEDQLMCAIALLQNGARKDIKDKRGRTAYDIAVEKKGKIATMMLSDLK